MGILAFFFKNDCFFLGDERMDAQEKSLMLLLAISIASAQSAMNGIFSNPDTMEWKQNLAVSERTGKYTLLS